MTWLPPVAFGCKIKLAISSHQGPRALGCISTSWLIQKGGKNVASLISRRDASWNSISPPHLCPLPSERLGTEQQGSWYHNSSLKLRSTSGRREQRRREKTRSSKRTKRKRRPRERETQSFLTLEQSQKASFSSVYDLTASDL